MLRLFGEYGAFLSEARTAFQTVGAVAPSGRFLARAMAHQLRTNRNGPARVLEVGPGTGAITREIVRYIRPLDRFDLVELSTAFAESLRNRFQNEHRFRQVRTQSRIINMSVQDLAADRDHAYDCVVCGLPFNNFPPELVHSLFERMCRLARPGGVISFFEYLWIRDLKRPFVSTDERIRLGRVADVIAGYLNRFEFRRDLVPINLPPAVVHHLRIGG
jgi:phospholipid N-methyltransferase